MQGTLFEESHIAAALFNNIAYPTDIYLNDVYDVYEVDDVDRHLFDMCNT